MQAVILDMDPGVDDALAIMLAAGSPELDIAAITTVSGNVPVATGTSNALKVLELIGRNDIPVYSGADCPLQRSVVHALEVHGEGGLGESDLPCPTAEAAGDAVPFLVEELARREREVTIVATGPLTNLARAEIGHPGILKKARHVVIMGGALSVPGNSAPRSEFNFFADPHAARRVVIESGANISLIPLDATRQVLWSRDQIQQELTTCPTVSAAFCTEATKTVIATSRKLYGIDGIYLHDPLAVGTAIDPAICRMEKRRIDVETEGSLTTGMVVEDVRPTLNSERATGVFVNCAVETDTDGFMRLFLERVLR